MATLGVIPARLGSTRLPRKPLRPIAGVPLVVRVWERVIGFTCITRCVVATDSEEILEVCQTAGAEAVLTSPSHPSGTDRVAEVVSMPRYSEFGTIVNIQGDEPFVSEDAVRAAEGLVSSGRFALGTVAAPADRRDMSNPAVVKVVRADDGRALYFSRAPIPFLRAEDDSSLLAELSLRHVGVYAYTPTALRSWVSLPEHPLERVERLEQLRPLAAGHVIGVAVIATNAGPGIDTEEDLAAANSFWKGFTSST